MEIDYEKLVKEAIKALDSFYGGDPKSKYIYASAVLTDKGNIYTASNYVSDTTTLTLHAEQVALAHAAAHKDARIVAIVSVGKEDPEGEKLCHPCGLCKQLIWENSLKSGIQIKVIMANLKGKYVAKDIKELVPYPWPE
ncbi:MAG: cytidine deaminase [Candidatus Aenigmatarchaeota archaeon]